MSSLRHFGMYLDLTHDPFIYFTIQIDRESSNLDNSMGYLLADDTLLCNFTHIIDDHDLIARNFHSSQYTRPNLILEYRTRQKWQLELFGHVSQLASEISIVEHTMSTMKLHQHRSYYALLEHVIQVMNSFYCVNYL